VKPISTFTADPAKSSTTASIVSSTLSHHAPTRAFLSAVFRYARGDIRGLAGRLTSRKSLLPWHFSPGSAPGFFCAPRRFAPADGCRAVSGVPGPPVVSHAARPPRFIFVGVTDHVGEGGRRRTFSFTRRSTSGLRSRLRSVSRSSFEAAGSILPRALPLAGLSGACLRKRLGSTPIESSASGIPHARSSGCEPARPYPLMGFDSAAPIVNRHRAVPSAY